MFNIRAVLVTFLKGPNARHDFVKYPPAQKLNAPIIVTFSIRKKKKLYGVGPVDNRPSTD